MTSTRCRFCLEPTSGHVVCDVCEARQAAGVHMATQLELVYDNIETTSGRVVDPGRSAGLDGGNEKHCDT